MESHYEVLGLSPTADEREVRRAYRTLLKEHHPDQGGSRERFLRIKEAYEALVGERPPTDPEPDGGVASRVGDGSTTTASDPTYDPDAVDVDDPGHQALSVDGEQLRLTLVGLVQHVSLERLVDGVPAATDRTVAFFRVRNTGSRAVSWDGAANASFIGDDGFLYQGSNIVSPHADRLPERWSASVAEIGPGRALDAVVIAQELPADVTVEQVVYTHHAGEDEADADTERYLFELRPLVRERLNRLPYR
ncbi:heat shock protein DnaJ domain protein [Haloterrigena turkmenica DSM 5511]|uniref:Heat shock protein DnaJ domain protein n=1 Tax=Haloterrigena turkmenica (strain ATCC 51198 / DSM 5511 / JCM 9101 / NCIMB 13204 / VKM B-1734 / 4k) TaxID=543526 RepID=D2RZG3_HALTV|nr:J domain-containing protein [Haloterrigena turkmenica]ADB60087.1 heat shock protein DnaJ domain protein [Haloterrigena turkmenica DSM 5511]